MKIMRVFLLSLLIYFNAMIAIANAKTDEIHLSTNVGPFEFVVTLNESKNKCIGAVIDFNETLGGNGWSTEIIAHEQVISTLDARAQTACDHLLQSILAFPEQWSNPSVIKGVFKSGHKSAHREKSFIIYPYSDEGIAVSSYKWLEDDNSPVFTTSEMEHAVFISFAEFLMAIKLDEFGQKWFKENDRAQIFSVVPLSKALTPAR